MANEDLSSYFDADNQKAQQRYQAALSAGYDPETAASLYLAPSQVKWKIIEAHPGYFQDPDTLSQIDSDFDTAVGSTVKNMGRDDSASQLVLGQMTPLAQKWSAMTAPDKLNLKDEAAAISRIKSGASTAIDELQNDPSLQKSSVLRTQERKELASGGKRGKGEYDKARLALAHKNFLEATDNTSRDAAAAILQQYDSGLPDTGAQPTVISTDSGDVPAGPIAPPPSFNMNDILAATWARQTPAVAPAESPAAVLASPKGKFFISGMNGKPDLTNYEGGRTGADAAWLAARPAPTATTTNADDAAAAILAQLPDSGTPLPSTNEVVRRTKDGRMAVFDADTRKFIRYAE